MNKQKNKGITLIALVVTIIVLLILAGISIMMLTGQNGILNRAGQAKEDTGNAQIDEMVKMSVMEALTNGNGRITEDLLREALDKNLGAGNYTLTGNETDGWTIVANGKTYKVDSNSTITSGTTTGGNTGDDTVNEETEIVSDGAGKTYPKPGGAKYVEGTVDTGLVIDINGSEFVWVPVENVVLDESKESELPRASDFGGTDRDYNAGTGDLTSKQDHSKMYTPMAFYYEGIGYKTINYLYVGDYVLLEKPESFKYINDYREPEYQKDSRRKWRRC